MKNTFHKAGELITAIKRYAKKKGEALKLMLAEKIAGVIAVIAAGFIAGVVFLFSVLFVSVAVSIAVGEWLGKPWLGFLITGFLYFLIGILVWKSRKRLIKLPVMNTILQQLFKNEDED